MNATAPDRDRDFGPHVIRHQRSQAARSLRGLGVKGSAHPCPEDDRRSNPAPPRDVADNREAEQAGRR